jgi:hypothetical protein
MKPYLLCLALAALSVWTASAQVPSNGISSASYIIAQGSTVSPRSQLDSWFGQVYIYVGGHLPVGTNLLEFRYLFGATSDSSNTTGYITPILIEYWPVEAFTVYAVVGIGKGFPVTLSPVPQTIPFDIIKGIKVPTSGNFTFGYINALVDSNGVPVETSLGTVDFDNPSDKGEGLGGLGTTNDWIATANLATPHPVVSLGTTFGAGLTADFPIVNPPYRTYSAQAYGVVVIP